jgi:hypothetical protein
LRLFLSVVGQLQGIAPLISTHKVRTLIRLIKGLAGFVFSLLRRSETPGKPSAEAKQQS